MEPFDVAEEPQKLGRYVVLGELGRGGMGVVLEAFDRALDRRVALKVLHRELGEQHTQRLLREAQALAKLSHPHVVQVYEVGEANGQAFIAMELVQGRSLREWLMQDPRPGWRECVQVYVQVGEGLAAAHAQGLVHRDFKPGNAVIDGAGRARVLDFGLARRMHDAADARPSVEARVEASVEPSVEEAALAQSLTRTGAVVGTPAYMAPEQLKGLEADARSDQFAYCVALYEALCGKRPFEGSSMAALMVSMLSGQVRPVPRGTEVPAAVRTVLLRGLAIDPGARWPSMDALLGELRRIVSPRRRGWLALGVAGGLAAIGLGIAQYAEVGFRCDGASAQLEGIWDEERRQALGDAILGTQLSYATDTWVRVEQRLDEYSQGWADKHTEVCEATSVRQEQSAEVMDLRMECLRGRKVALREAVKVLVQADATRVENAVDLLASLPGLSRCDDVEALAAELPPPEDPDVAAQVEALRESLVQAATLREAGVHGEALTVADAVMAQAEPLAYAPFLAEALLARGGVQQRLGHYQEAEQELERAFLMAIEHGHDQVATRAVVRLVAVVGDRQARHEAGLQWGRTALAMARSPGIEPEVEAAVLNNIGNVRESQGKLEDALTHHERALVIREEALGARHPHVAASLDNIGVVLRGRGKLADALTHHERALAIFEDALGSRHPDVAAALNNIGNVLEDQGEPEAALTHYERALAIFAEALGPRHVHVAVALDNIGNVLRRQGKLEDALTHYERALAISEEALGPGHLGIASPLNNIGNVLRRQGKLEDALTHHERALAVREQALGPRHVHVAVSLNNIAIVLVEQGKLEEARTHYERALVILAGELGPRHPDVAHALVGLADVALRQHDLDVAREHAEHAISILEASEASLDVLAEARFVLARALEPDRSQRARARAQAEQAHDGYAELGAAAQADLAEVQAWLAEHP
jgi:tetratricopeptide (TPR) repeat protein/tRNA A-37 threonylcarbamoyl transferase component Bud32